MDNCFFDIEMIDLIATVGGYRTILELSLLCRYTRARYFHDERFLAQTPKYDIFLRNMSRYNIRKSHRESLEDYAKGIVRTITDPDVGYSKNIHEWIVKDTIVYNMLLEAGCTFSKGVDVNTSIRVTLKSDGSATWEELKYYGKCHHIQNGVVRTHSHVRDPLIGLMPSRVNHTLLTRRHPPIGANELLLCVSHEELDNICQRKKVDWHASVTLPKGDTSYIEVFKDRDVAIFVLPVTLLFLAPVTNAKEKALATLSAEIREWIECVEVSDGIDLPSLDEVMADF